mgnify:CR=1 FL=1
MDPEEFQPKHESEFDPNLNLEQRVRIYELPDGVAVVDDDGLIEWDFEIFLSFFEIQIILQLGFCICEILEDIYEIWEAPH